jgi:hypothetical protein
MFFAAWLPFLQTVRTRFAFGKAFCSFAIASAAAIFTASAVLAAEIFFDFLLFPDPALFLSSVALHL